MKKLIAILLSVMMIVGMMVLPTAAADQEGDLNYGKDWYDISWYNTTDTVFEISTAKQLYGLAYLTYTADSIKALEAITKGKTFKLTADIDLNPGWSADSGNAAPVEFPGIVRFCGTLDGQGYTISGLYMAKKPIEILIGGKAAANRYIGLSSATDTTTARMTSHGDFGFICRVYDGTVKNLVMENGLVKNGAPFIATVAGNESVDRTVYGATVENVYIDVDAHRDAAYIPNGNTTGRQLGGIINTNYFAAKNSDEDAWIVLNNVVYAGKLSTDGNMANGMGGIVSTPQLTRSTSTYGNMEMTNCLFLGTMELGTTSSSITGPIIGKTANAGTKGTAYTLDNCYESAAALATAMAADATLANSWKTTDKGVVPATVAEMLNAQNVVIQRSAEVANETTFSLRILQGIDDLNLNWKSVGFRVELWDATNSKWYSPVDSTVNKVYTSITAAGEDVEASEEPFESDYIYGVVINGVPASGTVKLRITPLKEMVDGTVVYYTAQARICEIVDGVLPQAQA